MNMEHVLDNPMWNALNTGNKSLAEGNDTAKYFKRTVSAFAGMKNNSADDFECLYELSSFDTPVILFTPGELQIPPAWKINLKKDLLQMVYSGGIPAEGIGKNIVALSGNDVPAMVLLAGITKPGPFLPGTIEFGNYEGIFDGQQLIAMTGQRLQPDPFIEVSAVCTHPDYTGKGYGTMLIQSQLLQILQADKIPFLHVYPDNPARYLYQKLGFELRKIMMVYMLQKKRIVS